MKKLVLVVLALAIDLNVYSQDSNAIPARLERMMSAEEFQLAGLAKLTAAELASLNAWLQKFSSEVCPATLTTSSNTLDGKWLSLDSNTVRVLHDDGNYVYGQVFTRDGKDSVGTYDLTRQADGTIAGRGKAEWTCKFLCRDISCDVPQWIENSCVIDHEVVLATVQPNRVEGYIMAPIPPESHDKTFPTFCRKCGANTAKVKQKFVWVRIE